MKFKITEHGKTDPHVLSDESHLRALPSGLCDFVLQSLILWSGLGSGVASQVVWCAVVRDHTWRSMVKVKLLVTVSVADVLRTDVHPELIELST